MAYFSNSANSAFSISICFLLASISEAFFSAMSFSHFSFTATNSL